MVNIRQQRGHLPLSWWCAGMCTLSVLFWLLPISGDLLFTPVLTSVADAPWTLLSYPFFHKTFLHLGSNILLFTGVVLFSLFGDKKVYIFRPVLYTVFAFLFPLFLFTATTILIPQWMGSLSGASGLALLAFGSVLGCYKGFPFYLFAFLGIAIILGLLLQGNSAGHIVHLGALILGIIFGKKKIFIYSLTKGEADRTDMKKQIHESGYTSLSGSQRKQLIRKGGIKR